MHKILRFEIRARRRVAPPSTFYNANEFPDQVFAGDELPTPSTVEKRRQKKYKAKQQEAPEDQQDVQDLFAVYSKIRCEHLSETDERFSNAIREARRTTVSSPVEPLTQLPDSRRPIFLEGTRLITDALHAGGHLKQLFFSDRENLKGIPYLCPNASVFYVNYRQLQRWSGLMHPDGVMAIFEAPDVTVQESDSRLPITLICDNLRDPGNMGSIIRTAAAINAQRVLLTKGCVDVWNPKVLRGAMSAHFRIPIYSELTWTNIQTLLHPDALVHLADNAHSMLRLKKHEALMRENKQRRASTTSRDEAEYVSDSEDQSKSPVTPSDLSQSPSAYYLPLVVTPYYSIDFAGAKGDKRPVALIIGGETEGLSPQAFHLAHLRYGARLYIPCSPGVESLNSTVAGSVILCEMQRQFLQAAAGQQHGIEQS